MIVNLDPGNDVLPYECAVDVMELISLEDAMEELGLGPNGGLVYCMEYLEKNLDWLEEKISAECAGKYVLFDCPGQVELFTHHHSMRNIAEKLSAWGWQVRTCCHPARWPAGASRADPCRPGAQVCCVHLVDSHHCSDDSKFLSTALVALSAMTMLEMPHVNVLSKMDLVQCMGRNPPPPPAPPSSNGRCPAPRLPDPRAGGGQAALRPLVLHPLRQPQQDPRDPRPRPRPHPLHVQHSLRPLPRVQNTPPTSPQGVFDLLGGPAARSPAR